MILFLVNLTAMEIPQKDSASLCSFPCESISYTWNVPHATKVQEPLYNGTNMALICM